MATQDVNLAPAKAQDRDAENAKLREEIARLQAKRDNDEASAFGRLKAEAEARKRLEAEFAETKRKMAELESRNLVASMAPEQVEALGQAGAQGVIGLIDKKMAAIAPPSTIPPEQLAGVESRLAAVETLMRQGVARQSYNADLVSWATQSGDPRLFARLAPGGDLAEKWAAFAQQNPGAVAAYENADTEGTKAYVKLFVYENPCISQQAATPPASGGFAPPSDADQYSPQQWMAETEAFDAQRKSGQLSEADYRKAYVEANAKLAKAQNRR